MTSLNSRFALFAWVSLIGVTLVLRDCGGFGINKYLILVEYLGAFSWLKAKDIKSLLAFSMPLAYGLPFNYLALAAVVFLIIKSDRLPGKIVILLLIWLAIQELAMTFWYSDIDLGAEAGYIACLFLFVMLAVDDMDNSSRVLSSFIVGAAFAFLIVIQRTIVVVPLDSLLAGSSRLGYGGSGAYGAEVDGNISAMFVRFNPNEVGYYSLVSIACGLVLLIKSSVNRILIISCIAVSLLAGFLSQSRTWIMMVAALVVVQLVLSIRGSGERGRALIALGVFVCLALIVAIRNPLLIDMIVRRFEGADFVTANGRTELLDAYNDWFSHQTWRAFFGTGVVNYKEIAGLWNSIHSGIQQVYVCLGIVGSLAFVGIIIFIGLFQVRSSTQISPINYLPLIAVVAFSQSIQIVNPWSLLLPLAVGFVAFGVSGEHRRGLHGILGLRDS